MNNYQLSTSPYLNQLINNLFSQLQAKPQEGADLSGLQKELMQDISISKVKLQGEYVPVKEIIDNLDIDNLENLPPQVMSFLLMRVILKMKNNAIEHFISIQDKNILHYKVIVKPQDVFKNFIDSNFNEFINNEKTKNQANDFIQLIDKKFKSQVFMLDDLSNTPEIIQGSIALLENSTHVVIQTKKENLSIFSQIIIDLITKDKQIKNSLIKLLNIAFSHNDPRARYYMEAVIQDYISLTVTKLSKEQNIYIEQPLQKFINAFSNTAVNLYLMPDDITEQEQQVNIIEFVQHLATRQFNPRYDTKKIKDKLGVH